MPTLTIQLPGLPSVEHIVREDAITLGRMKGNSISLNDSSVSLSHAKITRIGNDFFLKDLNSTNGTMLNGQSISEARLREGDQLKFGEVIAYFRLEPLSAPASEPLSTGSESVTVLVPKPVAQSVPTPTVTPPAGSDAALAPQSATQSVPPPPAAILPVSPKPVPAIRQPVPPPSAPRRKSPRLPLLMLGGVAGLAVVGFLAWRFSVGTPKPVAHTAAKPAPANVGGAPSQNQNLDDLMKALKSPDVAVRRRAASAIYNLGPAAKEALPALPEVLTDADPEVRMWVALALVHNNVYDKATIPILIQTLHNENPTLRQVACLSLAMIPYTEAEKKTVIPALMEVATKDASAAVANDAMTALKIIAPDL